VLQRPTPGTLFDQREESLQMVGRERGLAAQQQRRPIPAQDVAEQQLGVEFGLDDACGR